MLNKLYKSCLSEVATKNNISDVTQICSLDPYLTDYQDAAGIYYTDDNDRALGESFLALLCQRVLGRWSQRKRGKSVCECDPLDTLFREYACNNFLDDYISKIVLAIDVEDTNSVIAVLEDAQQRARIVKYWAAAPCLLGEDGGGLQMQTRLQLQQHIGEQLQVLDDKMRQEYEMLENDGYFLWYYERLHRQALQSPLLTDVFWLKYIYHNMPPFAFEQYGIKCRMYSSFFGDSNRCFQCTHITKVKCKDEDPWYACGLDGKYYAGKLHMSSKKKEWNPWALAVRICSARIGVCANKKEESQMAPWYTLKMKGQPEIPFTPPRCNATQPITLYASNGEDNNIPSFYDDTLVVEYPIEITRPK